VAERKKNTTLHVTAATIVRWSVNIKVRAHSAHMCEQIFFRWCRPLYAGFVPAKGPGTDYVSFGLSDCTNLWGTPCHHGKPWTHVSQATV